MISRLEDDTDISTCDHHVSDPHHVSQPLDEQSLEPCHGTGSVLESKQEAQR
jgi:hypothetical protein